MTTYKPNKNVKLVGIPTSLKKQLDKAKTSDYESYGGVIARALDALNQAPYSYHKKKK